jgi:uncharacterized protein YdaU (DUF1376 family)
MAELTWLPYDLEEWETRTRELSLDEEGALMRLLRHAWEAEEFGTIADSESTFDRILGSRWKKLLPLIRAHFTPVADRPGRLRCDWFVAMHDRQLAKHRSYQERGGKGGRPRKLPESSALTEPPQPESSAISSAFQKARKRKAGKKADSRENTTETKSCGSLQTHTAFSPPADALALEAARAAGEPPPGKTPGTRREQDDLDRASPAEVEAAEAYVAAHPEIAASIDAQLGVDAPAPPLKQGWFHDRRLQQVTARVIRRGLVLAAYRARSPVEAPA